MVFRTIREGFPNSEIIVWLNQMPLEAKMLCMGAARRVKATLLDIGISKKVRHDQWIKDLFFQAKDPFWICDTDVAFFGNCEGWFKDSDTLYSGRLIPRFYEQWTKTFHRERLHTCLMWFNPQAMRTAMEKFMARFPESWMQPQLEFFLQHYLPTRTGSEIAIEFNDSTAGLWHTIGGTPFTQDQNLQFEHLNCATYADLIGPSIAPNFESSNRAITLDPLCCRGLQIKQAEYYERNACRPHP